MEKQALSCLKLPTFEVVKETKNTVVLETTSNFIKVHLVDAQDPRIEFRHIVLSAFAEEYRQMGIDWEVQFVTDDVFGALIVERREKLQVLTEADATVGKALKSVAKTTRKVERKLGFPKLTAQVAQMLGVDSLSKIIIARNTESTIDDFAMKNGQIVSLGSSELFLATINNDEWASNLPQVVGKVSLNCGAFIFAPDNMFDDREDVAGTLFRSISMWWCFSLDVAGVLDARKQHFKSMEKMFSTNAKILHSKKPEHVATESDFNSEGYLEWCRQLSLASGKNSKATSGEA